MWRIFFPLKLNLTPMIRQGTLFFFYIPQNCIALRFLTNMLLFPSKLFCPVFLYVCFSAKVHSIMLAALSPTLRVLLAELAERVQSSCDCGKDDLGLILDYPDWLIQDFVELLYAGQANPRTDIRYYFISFFSMFISSTALIMAG